MKVFYSDAYVRAAHSFDTVRKSAAIAGSLVADPIAGVEVVAPAAVAVEQLTTVHSHAYVKAVRTGHPAQLAMSQGFPWDPGVWESTTASSGGCIEAARAALIDGASGSLSSGLHHARHDAGAGFCTFNGLALAAYAITAEVPGNVLIVDLDAHCGGGTASLNSGNDRIAQLDVAVSGYDRYSPTRGNGSLDIVHDAGRYLDSIAARLKGSSTDVALILYNAGMDPFEGCDIGGLPGITAEVLVEREHLVFEWAATNRLPIAFVLAGGYAGPRLSSETLTTLHRSTIAAAARAAEAWLRRTLT